jgi:hypothetical protein
MANLALLRRVDLFSTFDLRGILCSGRKWRRHGQCQREYGR